MKKREKYAYIALLATAVLIFISFTLTKFNEDIQKRVYKLQVTSLQNLSKQSGAVVEKNLEGMVNTLYALTEFLDKDDDFVNEENLDRLRKFAGDRDLMFQRFGLADKQGIARVTNGKTIDISSRKYFQDCMREKRASSENPEIRSYKRNDLREGSTDHRRPGDSRYSLWMCRSEDV